MDSSATMANARSRLSTAIAIGLSLILVGCASSHPTESPRGQRDIDRATDALAKRSDADSLAAAGLLSLTSLRHDPLDLLARATAAAPDRPDLLWLQIRACLDTPACDPEPIERRLRQLDPDNGTGWLVDLTRASAAKDYTASDAILAGVGRSDHVDIYWTTLIAHLTRATARTHTISITEAGNSIIGALASSIIPAFAAASNSCQGERLQRPDVLEACRGVARALQRGDTYITEMMGVTIALRVWPEGSPEWRAADDARRLYEYRSKLSASAAADAAHTEEFLTLCEHNRREQDVFLAQLKSAGKNPNPSSAE
jgi:hypothetical protein